MKKPMSNDMAKSLINTYINMYKLDNKNLIAANSLFIVNQIYFNYSSVYDINKSMLFEILNQIKNDE